MRNVQSTRSFLIPNISTWQNSATHEINSGFERLGQIVRGEKKLTFLKLIRQVLTPNNDPSSPGNFLNTLPPNLSNPIRMAVFVAGKLSRLIQTVLVEETNLLSFLNQEIKTEKWRVMAKREERAHQHNGTAYSDYGTIVADLRPRPPGLGPELEDGIGQTLSCDHRRNYGAPHDNTQTNRFRLFAPPLPEAHGNREAQQERGHCCTIV